MSGVSMGDRHTQPLPLDQIRSMIDTIKERGGGGKEGLFFLALQAAELWLNLSKVSSTHVPLSFL
jgi:hypothetical protein